MIVLNHVDVCIRSNRARSSSSMSSPWYATLSIFCGQEPNECRELSTDQSLRNAALESSQGRGRLRRILVYDSLSDTAAVLDTSRLHPLQDSDRDQTRRDRPLDLTESQKVIHRRY